MGRQRVIGQTGTTKLSDDSMLFTRSQKRSVRYRIVKVAHGFVAEVIGPFHSSLYGTGCFGTSRYWAMDALKRRLANDHGYIGQFSRTDKDTADTVGVRYPNEMTSEAPISLRQLVGAAGQ